MQPACSSSHPLLPEGATALEIPSDRPAFVKSFRRPRVYPAETAVRLASERRVPHPGSIAMYVNLPTIDPGMEEDLQLVAYVYITPADAPCRARPGPFLRRVFRTLALDLPQTFEILSPLHGADASVRFRTHAEREEAMRRQPFQLDGATVELLVPFRVINVAHPGNYFMAHVALHEYPPEQQQVIDVVENCAGFGSLQDIGRTATDRSEFCVVLQLEHPREIPHELHIEYFNGYTSVVPVEILSVWECSKSFNANGEYVSLFHPRAPPRPR